MYVPTPYAVDDSAAWSVLREAAAGTLIVATHVGLRAVFVPVIPDESNARLRTHVARANPWWNDAHDGDEVLASFVSSYGYVSPSMYPSRRSDPRVVPTWDYVACEVHGSVRIHDDPEWVINVVREMTLTFENARSPEWRLDESSPDYVSKLVRAIVGVEIIVERVTGVTKLSQSRPLEDRQVVVEEFAAGTGRERHLAQLMGHL